MAGAVRRIGVGERRARLARRHHLAPAARAAGVVEVAGDLVGLHGTDPASVFLAAAARMRRPEVGAIERAMYEDRVLLRMLGMRRTMFVVPVELAPVVQAACTDAIAAAQRSLLLRLLEESGITDDPKRWLEEVEEATIQALGARGQALAAELATDEPRLREQIQYAEGKSYASRQSVSTRVLLVLAAEGRIARGRPRGSWISGQYRWSLMESWLPQGMAEWSTEAAQAELVHRWLVAFGPGTMADLRWWTGLTAGQVKRALAAVGAVEVDLDGTPGLVLAHDLEPPADVAPWVALLPALDPTVMGWSGRDWYLGGHGPTLFDRNGNAGPTVWWDGRVVGGWASRADGEIAVRLLEDVGAEGAAAVEAAAGGLAGWLAGARVTPRFRTPLERELSA
jgi:hypothetical protein